MYEIPGYRMSGVAQADFTNKSGCGVVVGTVAGTLAIAAASLPIDGVLNMEGTSGQMVTAVVDGIVIGLYGGNVVAGDKLTMDASGQFITAVATNAIVGKAMEAGATGEKHPVLLGYKGLA